MHVAKHVERQVWHLFSDRHFPAHCYILDLPDAKDHMREVYQSEVARKKEEQEKENQAKVSHREAVQSKLQGAVDALKELSRQQELGNRNLTSALMLLVPLSVAQEDTEAKMKMFDEYNKRLKPSE